MNECIIILPHCIRPFLATGSFLQDVFRKIQGRTFWVFFFFKYCFLLIPSSAPPIFSYFLARRIQFPTARHLGHGFGKQLVYDLIYTCSGRDFIDGYIILFLAHSSPQRKKRFPNAFNDFLVNKKNKTKNHNDCSWFLVRPLIIVKSVHTHTTKRERRNSMKMASPFFYFSFLYRHK